MLPSSALSGSRWLMLSCSSGLGGYESITRVNVMGWNAKDIRRGQLSHNMQWRTE